MSKPGAQILLSSIILQQEELGLFREISHSTTREGNMQDKHRASYHPECKECSRKEKKENEKKEVYIYRDLSKGHRNKLEEVPMTQAGIP